MNWTALAEGLAQYRAALDAPDAQHAAAAGDRAQGMFITFGVSLAAWLALVSFGFIALRCVADAFGAFDAHETPDLASWLYADLAQQAASAGWLALAWTLLGVSVHHTLERLSARLYAGLRNEPVPAWRWPWKR